MPKQVKPPWTVLVLPADSAAGMAVHRALRYAKEAVLLGADHSAPSVAAFCYRRLHQIPALADPDCVSRLRQLIAAEKIDAIFPVDDATALWLAAQREQFDAEIIAPSLDVCQSCAAPEQLQEILPAQVTITSNDAIQSRRTCTIVCFSRPDGTILYARVHNPDTLAFIDLPQAEGLAETISKKFGLCGAWFFELRAGRRDEWQVTRVSPTIHADVALHHAAGCNLPLLCLYQTAGYELEVGDFNADFRAIRLQQTKFIYDRPLEALYMDLDGSLLMGAAVNPQLVALIYQCHNRKVPVHLVTRHPGDLDATLRHMRLTGLFDRIIHVTDPAHSKAQYIQEKNAVLIDDSFAERRQTERLLGIRCFDPAAAIAVLLDDRDETANA